MERKEKATYIKMEPGDKVIINRKPFIGQTATVMLVRDDMASVDLGYGYTRPWVSVRDLIKGVQNDIS